MTPGRFHIGTAASETGQRIIYNQATGELLYDQDGTGAIAQVMFARLDPNLALDFEDFLTVA